MFRIATIIVVGSIVGLAVGEPIYSVSPDWVSADTEVSTGAALVDLDRDGWLDFVVANGNDIHRQRLVVYYNQGDGTYPVLPDWASADVAYNGHLDVADVNGDGWLDVAVAVLLSEGGAAAKVYLNHNGTLSSTPDWTSVEVADAFGVAFGDVNNDGRPDLAVATGFPYSNPNSDPNYVYMNVDGELELTASWETADTRDYMSALWVDADDDGWLDLVFLGANNLTYLYRNAGGSLLPAAVWESNDNPGQFAIMAADGDVTGDGLRDLFVTDNVQLFDGTGELRQYNGLADGYFADVPDWSFYTYAVRYGSSVALADVNADGLLDAALGAWWSRARVFLNDGTGFGSAPDWTAQPTSVIEKIVFGDIDKNGLRPCVQTFATAMGQRLFYLPHQPIQAVTGVRVDGVQLFPHEFVADLDQGWVSVGRDAVAEVTVAYTYSSNLDLAITNWDSDEGNFVHYSRLVVPGDANCDGTLNNFDIDYFVLLLTDPEAYDNLLPDCDGATFCDMNEDGVVNNFDIDPFVAALIAG